MAKTGRPSKYSTINLDQVKKLVLRGWTDLQMSDFFGVDETTWHRWKEKHPEFCQSLKDWKVEADAIVERCLFERATGYSHPEDKIFKPAGEDPTIVPTIKHYPPDTVAGIFWLKNRQPGKWREKQDVSLEHSGEINQCIRVVFEDGSPVSE